MWAIGDGWGWYVTHVSWIKIAFELNFVIELGGRSPSQPRATLVVVQTISAIVFISPPSNEPTWINKWKFMTQPVFTLHSTRWFPSAVWACVCVSVWLSMLLSVCCANKSFKWILQNAFVLNLPSTPPCFAEHQAECCCFGCFANERNSSSDKVQL